MSGDAARSWLGWAALLGAFGVMLAFPAAFLALFFGWVLVMVYLPAQREHGHLYAIGITVLLAALLCGLGWAASLLGLGEQSCGGDLPRQFRDC